MGEYLDFKEISKTVPFNTLLDHLNIPYETCRDGLKGQFPDGKNFIINVERQLFLCPQCSDRRGGVINFASFALGLPLREAAKRVLGLSRNSDEPGHQPKRDIPELELHFHPYLEKQGITQETAKALEIGLVKVRSIMAGKLAFRVRNSAGEPVGYVGYDITNGRWTIPKGYEPKHVWNLEKATTTYCVLTSDPFHAARFHSVGLTCVCSLLSETMTKAQAVQLERFKKILLIHPNGDNVAMRLSKESFVKQIEPPPNIAVMTFENIKAYF